MKRRSFLAMLGLAPFGVAAASASTDAVLRDGAVIADSIRFDNGNAFFNTARISDTAALDECAHLRTSDGSCSISVGAEKTSLSAPLYNVQATKFYTQAWMCSEFAAARIEDRCRAVVEIIDRNSAPVWLRDQIDPRSDRIMIESLDGRIVHAIWWVR